MFWVLKKVGLAYIHAIPGNGILSNSQLCNVNGEMLFKGYLWCCLLIYDLILGMTVRFGLTFR